MYAVSLKLIVDSEVLDIAEGKLIRPISYLTTLPVEWHTSYNNPPSRDFAKSFYEDPTKGNSPFLEESLSLLMRIASEEYPNQKCSIRLELRDSGDEN